MLQGLERFDLPDLQVNISWALTNVACGTQEDTHRLVEEGGTEALLRVMVSGTNEAKDQAIWALGNIAADCLNCRQMLQVRYDLLFTNAIVNCTPICLEILVAEYLFCGHAIGIARAAERTAGTPERISVAIADRRLVSWQHAA